MAAPPAGGFRTDYGTYGTNPAGGAYAAPPSPSSPSVPTTPNYEALIQADPNYVAWQTNSVKNLSDAASTRQAAIRALVEQFGGMPAGFTDKYGDLAPADLSLASSNPYSTEATLARAHEQNVAAMRKALAARGALHSGDLGFNQNQIDTTYGSDQYNAAQQFAQQLQDAINAYTGTQASDRSAEAAAIAQAYSDIIGNPAYVPTA